jgi:predicted nucleic acid-binding protein
MKAVYLESSAVVAWLFSEASAAVVIRATEGADVVVTSQLTIVEAERTIQRVMAQGIVKEAKARKLRGALERERARWTTMALTDRILARAGTAFPIEPVKTLDAIHLATALAFSEAFPDLAVLSLDRRVTANATALGLLSA